MRQPGSVVAVVAAAAAERESAARAAVAVARSAVAGVPACFLLLPVGRWLCLLAVLGKCTEIGVLWHGTSARECRKDRLHTRAAHRHRLDHTSICLTSRPFLWVVMPGRDGRSTSD